MLVSYCCCVTAFIPCVTGMRLSCAVGPEMGKSRSQFAACTAKDPLAEAQAVQITSTKCTGIPTDSPTITTPNPCCHTSKVPMENWPYREGAGASSRTNTLRTRPTGSSSNFRSPASPARATRPRAPVPGVFNESRFALLSICFLFLQSPLSVARQQNWSVKTGIRIFLCYSNSTLIECGKTHVHTHLCTSIRPCVWSMKYCAQVNKKKVSSFANVESMFRTSTQLKT